MPISSFYGMQTSLRGFIAQQRMLDTTGHNIANASTVGYSRQEATLSASLALQIRSPARPTRPAPTSAPASTSQGFRRIRDQFLDAQYRAQNTNLNDWKAQRRGARHRRALARRARRHRHQRPADEVLEVVVGPRRSRPTTTAAKQALVQQAGALTDSIHSVRSQMVAAQERREGQYDADRRPRRRGRQDRDRARGPEQDDQLVRDQRRLARTT